MVRILLVNDAEGIREIISYMLWRILPGCTITEAEDGNKALKVYRKAGKRGYDLVLTDIVHPGLDGIELIKAIHKANPKQTVAITSACSRDKASEVPHLMLPFEFVHFRDFVLGTLKLPQIEPPLIFEATRAQQMKFRAERKSCLERIILEVTKAKVYPFTFDGLVAVPLFDGFTRKDILEAIGELTSEGYLEVVAAKQAWRRRSWSRSE